MNVKLNVCLLLLLVGALCVQGLRLRQESKYEPRFTEGKFPCHSQLPICFPNCSFRIVTCKCISSYSQIVSCDASHVDGVCKPSSFQCSSLGGDWNLCPKLSCADEKHCCWYESYPVIISMKYPVNSLIFLHWRQDREFLSGVTAI